MKLRILYFLFCLSTVGAFAQNGTLRGTVAVDHQNKTRHEKNEVVVWLTPLEHFAAQAPLPPTKARLAQHNRQFEPRVVVVTVGSSIDFPNLDPYFHNVFSIYRGKPFDLGLYEGGSKRQVRFTQPGVSYIFCNIHPEMTAAVLALPTPYFVMAGDDGKFAIANVPPGQYRFELWYEFAAGKELASLSRVMDIREGENSMDPVVLHATEAGAAHLNKYGETYQASHKTEY